MNFFVYLLISKIKDNYVSYVGYTKNLKNRIKLHNSGKGAKFTKGKNWILVYKKKYNNKSEAMKEEFKLKNDKKKRSFIKMKYINNL
jgi:putative endonuclease